MLFGGLNQLPFTKHLGYRALKNWCLLTVVLEKTLERPLDCKEIKPINPKENQPWIFIRRTDAEAETPILWPPDAKTWLIRKKSWCWARLKAEGEGDDDRGRDGWMASLTQWTWVWVDSRSWWWTGRPGGAVVHGVAKSWKWLSDWHEMNWKRIVSLFLAEGGSAMWSDLEKIAYKKLPLGIWGPKGRPISQ